MGNDQLIFYTTPQGNIKVDIIFEDESFWLNQKRIAALFDVDVRTVNEHLKNIYETCELQKDSTIRNFRIVQNEGSRNVARNIDFYSLDVIIAVGYRISSIQTTQFRIWATKTLKDKGRVTLLEAKLKAEQEYDKFRVIQDQEFESDFDREIKKLKNENRNE